MSAPQIVTRAEQQPYVAIRGHVTMAEIGAFAVRTPEVYAWLGAHGVAPAGPPFLKYNVIDMMRQLEIDNGVPVAAPVDGDGDVIAGAIPPGRCWTWPPRRAWPGTCRRMPAVSDGAAGWSTT